MKRFFIIFYCYSILVGFQSCVKDANVKLPAIESKLVVSCFISPQDPVISAAVSLSSPLYNNPNVSTEYTPLLNALVTINDGITNYNLTYNSNLQRYVIDSFQLKITGGVTYNLSVVSQDGKHVNATTTVPAGNKSLKYTVTVDALPQYTLHGTWQDPGNTTDYYLFETRYTDFRSYWYDPSTTDTIKSWGGKSDYIKDTEKSGGLFTRDHNFIYNGGKNDTVFVSLTTLSKDYFDYYSKFNLAYNSSSTPFSEPVQMVSNINGGLGMFAGYNTYRLRVFP